MMDIILKNGLIADGTGRKAFPGDVALKDGKIAAIGSIDCEAKEIIDVSGLVVAPGFIDIHSHSDTTFLIDDKCEGKIFQGITTELAGQCGSTVYPCLENKTEDMKFFAKDQTGEYERYASCSYKDYRDKCKEDKRKMSTNLASLIGHGALRAGVMGQEARKASDEELRQMQSLLERDMKEGAWGVSLGLGYSPGINADSRELSAIGEIVSKYGGIITSHMRNQGDTIFEALEEMYDICRETNVKMHIAHLKLSGKKNWGQFQKVLNSIENANKEGLKVTADMYPYTASSSGITNSFPKWSIEGGIHMAAKRLQIPEERAKIMAFLEEEFQTGEEGESLLVVSTNGKFPLADGKNIYEISRELNLSMAETIAKITAETMGETVCISFCISQEDMLRFLKSDIAIGSDGSGYPLDERKNNGKPHPRNFAAFPRFLRLVREKQLCSLETAVYRMTKKSADIIGLTDRGTLEMGKIADITVFNPETVGDNNSFHNPFMPNSGIEYVLLQGDFAVYKGIQTDKRLGRFLLK